MKYTVPSENDHLTLDEAIARLSRHPRVEGVLQIGSLADGGLTDASDYDLVIVLCPTAGDTALPPWYVGITQMDHRLTDLIFVAAPEVDRLLGLTAPVHPGHPLGPIVRWIQRGTLIHDRAGLVGRAKRHLAAKLWVEPTDDQAAHATWFSINYNLAQTRRMVQAGDPLYRTTAEVRMAVYGHTDLWHGYFTLRRLSWEGDKAAVAHLLEHDPAFLNAFRQFIAEPTLSAKLEAYERAAAIATATMGGLWPPDATAMNVSSTLEIWQSLMEANP